MDVLDVTRELVAIDSQNPGPGEVKMADVIAADLVPSGAEVRVIEAVDGRPNLLVTVDRGPGPHLGLSGHLDTKPIGGARDEWRTDPLSLTVQDDLAYGLGSSDMKGAVAAMLIALHRFGAQSGRGRLTLILTADEEQGSNAGAKALTRQGMPALDALVIGEPSGIAEPWEAIYLVSRGICCFTLDVRTRQGHSGLSTHLGRNAVLVAADLARAFEHFEPPVAEPDRVPCSPTVNSGILTSGGVCFGTWPGHCTLGVEIRLVPGMDRDEVRASIETLIAKTVGDSADTSIGYQPGSLGWMPAVSLAPSAPVVAAAQRAAHRVLGRELPLGAYPGGTDATYFLGEAGIPTITSLGPGWLSVAHGANECVGISQLYQACDLYEALVTEFAAGSDER